MKSAVIIVHGIGPIDRYQIQDQFAAELRDALNTETDEERAQRFAGSPPQRDGQWHSDVYWPPVPHDEQLEGLRPTAVRVHCDARGSDVPHEPVIDIFEGYWSPIDKEQTNAVRVVNWMMRSIFAPVGDARLDAPLLKNAYDIACAVAVALLVPLLTVFVLASAYRAWVLFAPSSVLTVIALLVGLVGAYFVAQAVARLAPLLFATRGGRSVWRPILLLIFGAVLVGTMAVLGGASFEMTGVVERVAWLLGATLAARLLLSLMRDFLDDRIGDLQIYCTHNENQRYYLLREQILSTVGDIVLRVLRTKEGPLGTPLYDRVYLVGHSLGATILMDTIVELHRLMMEGGLDAATWRRLRAFVTYGSALEKTRYFFSVARPTFSAQVTEFKADLYNRLFTEDSSALRSPETHGEHAPMYWINYWYFSDIVANAMKSYGPCVNVRLASPSAIWSHSFYLDDRRLWHSQPGRRGLATIVASA